MEAVTYDFILEAATPVAHHAENLGNMSILMRRKQRLPTGEFIDLPVVSGDSMRHGLREAGMLAYMEAAGLKDLTTAALRLLFAGGQITGSSGGGVSISGYREMVELCPPLGLLGGCVNNRMIPGRMTVDEAVLICEETVPVLPPWVGQWLADSGAVASPMRSHVEEVMRVRMDPTSRPERVAMLSASEQTAVEQRIALSEKASGELDHVGKAENASTIMPRSFERIAAGSLLYWQVRANTYGELDHDTFHVMLGRFLGDLWVGGKRGTGHGNLRPVTARKIRLSASSTVESMEVQDVSRRIGSVFHDHVTARQTEIAKFMREVEA